METQQQEKIIEKMTKWQNYTQDPQAVVFDELDAISDKLEFIKSKLDPMDLSEAETIKGDAGYTPELGKDYLTQEEIDAIKAEILSQATPDVEKIIQEAVSRIPIPENGLHGMDGVDGISPELDEIKSHILSDTEFIDSLRGKDGETPEIEAQEIADNLNTLPNSVNFNVIKGLSEKLAQNASQGVSLPASIRIRAQINGVPQNEPVGSINFPSGTTHTGQDYSLTGGAGITAWTANKAYLANDVVYQGSNFYKRIANGTSGATFDATEEATWNVMGTTGSIAPWITLSYYEVGEVVVNNGTIYRTTIAHTAGATFDVTEAGNFTVIANYTDIGFYSASTYYPVGKMIYDNGRIVTRNTAGISGAVQDNTERLNWSLVAADVTSYWTASTFYYDGERVIYYTTGANLIKSGSSPSGATFNSAELTSWVFAGNYLVFPWIASQAYFTDQQVLTPTTGNVVKSTTNRVSTGQFDATEAAFWSVVTLNGSTTAFSANIYYHANNQVTQGTRVLKRIAGGFSGSFTNTEAVLWTMIANPVTGTFTGTTYYYAGEKIIQGGVYIERITSGISNATFTAGESVLWTALSIQTISAWTGNTVYYPDQIVTQGTRLIKRIAVGISPATFTNAEASLWTLVSNDVIGNWTASTYYYTGEQVRNNGAIWAKKVSGASTATFNATEILLWDLVSGNNSTTVATTYTVLENDDMVDITTSGAFTITIPAGRVNKIIKFSTGSLGATPPTIATSGGETIINPSTYASGTSFVMPGVTGSASSVQFQLVGSQYRFIA